MVSEYSADVEIPQFWLAIFRWRCLQLLFVQRKVDEIKQTFPFIANNNSQVIVQRALAAKNLVHAKAGCILAGYLKFLPVKRFVFNIYLTFSFIKSNVILFIDVINGDTWHDRQSFVSR